MASSLSEEECTCPVCCDIFRDPVVLLCGHSFCTDCLQQWWRQSSTKTCPVCKELFNMRQPPRNLALRNLSDNLRQEKSQRASTVQDHKTKLKTARMHLRTKEATFKRVKGVCDKIATYIKLQAQQTEKGIKEDFEKMYRFLRAEETSRIDALRTDERQKSLRIQTQMDNLNSEISSISNTLKLLEEQLIAEDVPFMLNFKTTIARAQDQATLPDPQIPTGTLIDEAKHQGNVQFKVWRKMKGIIQYRPVILDPNTARTNVTISENLSSVKGSDRAQQVPDIPERRIGICHLSGSVRGSEWISSGRHSWEVEVDGYWGAGVATVTGDKTWSIYKCPCTDMLRELTPESDSNQVAKPPLPNKIMVLLDYDQGKLSFYDLKGKTHLHTITHSFTKPVIPCFRENVKILPVEF